MELKLNKPCLILIGTVLFYFSLPMICAAAENNAAATFSWNHISNAFFVWSYKISTLFVGYLFARLGYKLFIKGITGEFKFSTKFKGLNADLVSASPGLFFIFMGAIIISVGLYKGMELNYSSPPQSSNTVINQGNDKTNGAIKPPKNPFKGDKK